MIDYGISRILLIIQVLVLFVADATPLDHIIFHQKTIVLC